jgi:ATP-dependent Clp protease ATP-binding subunit ClpA
VRWLEITSGPLDGRSFALDGPARVGSGDAVSIRVPVDAGMLPEHAVLERSEWGGLTIRPLADALVQIKDRRAEGATPVALETEFLCGSTWMRVTETSPPDPGDEGEPGRDLDDAAEKLVARATQAARGSGHLYTCVEHLALELLAHAGASQVLASQGVSARQAAEEIRKALWDRAGAVRLEAPCTTPRLLRVLELAREESAGRAGPPQLMAGLLREGRSLTVRILEARGLKTGHVTTNALARASGRPLGRFLRGVGRNLTALAAQGKLSPLVGRADELKRLIQVLGRAGKKSAVLVGDAGIGKTSLVEGLAQVAARADAPPFLRAQQIVEVPVGSLVVATTFRGQLEERIRLLVLEASRPDVILFLDEIHMLMGAGGTQGSEIDAANLLKTALANGELAVIGATTHPEYRSSIERDAAMERRFEPIFLKEPPPEEAREILRGVAPRLQERHGVTFLPEAIEAAVELSVQYLKDRRLPDKAIDLLDAAAARRTLAQVSTGESAAIEVGADDVADTLAERVGHPVTAASGDAGRALLELDELLAEQVLGQPAAVAAVADVLRATRAGLSKRRGPQGAFLFLGPTGVGKTELARALARTLFGGEQALLAFDMSEYQEKHTVSRLVGAPPGYSGHEQGGLLTEAVRRRPSAVVLFDEIEKACPDVFDVLLQLLDEGRLTDTHGRTADFRGTVVVLTSNLQPGKMDGKPIAGFAPAAERGRAPDPRRALEGRFRPELLNRLDEVVEFHPLDRAALRRLLDRYLEPAREQLSQRGAELAVADDAYDWLVKIGRTEDYGARELARSVRQHVEQPLARVLLSGRPLDGAVVRVALVDDRIAVTL